MAEIILTFNTTARQDAKLAKALARANAERLFNGEEEFEDVPAWFRYVMIDAVKSYIRQQDTTDGQELLAAYTAATETTQDEVEGLLGIDI